MEFDNLDLPDFCHLHVHDENQAVSFNDALAGCVFRGGHLVSIHDGESNKVISEYSEHHFTIIGLYHQTSVAGLSFGKIEVDRKIFYFVMILLFAFQDQVALSGPMDLQMMATIIGQILSLTNQK